MQINSLSPSNITEAKPAAAVIAAPPPVKTPPKVATPNKADEKTPGGDVLKAPPKPGITKEDPTAAAKTTIGTKTEITDVKPTGEQNAEGDPTFTLKVNGKEYKATQSEIITLAQKAKGADAAMQRASEVEKLAENLLTNFDNDTFGLLVKRHGKEKAKEIAISMVKNLIAEEAKDPKDIELDELRAKAKHQEELDAATKKEKDDNERRTRQRDLYRTMLTDIDKELNETHLPKDKLTLTRVLNYLAAGKKANGQEWTIKEAVKAVEVEDMAHATHYAKRYVEGKLPSEKFVEIFGKDALKKLNQDQINLLKHADKIAKNGTAPISENGSGAEVPAKKPRTLSKTKGAEGISEREWRKLHGSLGGI